MRAERGNGGAAELARRPTLCLLPLPNAKTVQGFGIKPEERLLVPVVKD